MYPNPQDALPLPPHPDVAQYRKRAKDLAAACRTGEAQIDEWAHQWIRDLSLLQAAGAGARHEREMQRSAEQVSGFARDRLVPAACALNQAQFVIARAHGFASWPAFVRHLEGLSGARSPISAFEAAADAIVSGDLERLGKLLAEDPTLVHARSDREHGATLLHYVSANGVENYRQRTPGNVVTIARRLLDAGARVDAEADVYGGGATTLGLVVTSTPPRIAGVQIALADVLLDRGARMDDDILRDCLMNGCPEAAEHLARRGARVDLESAAGIGWIDEVQRALEARGPAVSTKELADAMMMATWYDRPEVIALLLDRGVDPSIRHVREGHTPLHLAAYEGRLTIAELLLRRGAPVNVHDDTYGTTPLVWALHAMLVDGKRPAQRWRDVARLLIRAGADVKPEWLEQDQVKADAELLGLLAGAARGGEP